MILANSILLLTVLCRLKKKSIFKSIFMLNHLPKFEQVFTRQHEIFFLTSLQSKNVNETTCTNILHFMLSFYLISYVHNRTSKE